jgi:hypothetical protein
MVNFEDFAVLADGWLTDYAISDLNTMADEWLEVAEPNISLEIDGDSNDGYVEVEAGGLIADTRRVFLLVDGELVEEISGFRGGWPLYMDVAKYGGGERQLKAVSIDKDGRVTCMKITNIGFSSPLNYLMLPSEYEPNKPLYFSAFNPNGGNVTVKVYADCGNLVWSQSYGGDRFFGSIPAGITGQHEIDYVSFDKSGGECSIKKIPDPKEPGIPTYDVKALIILPNLLINLVDFRTIWTVERAFNDRGIKYVKLGSFSASYDTIASYAKNNPIKYIYVGSHGGDGKLFQPDSGTYYFEFDGGTRRTWVELSDGRCVSMKYTDAGAPSWCKDLGYWENRSKSFASMGFKFLEFAYFDSCHSGRLRIDSHDQLIEGQPGQQGLFDVPHSDMSLALGMDEPSRSRFYQGWWNEIPGGLPWPLEGDYQKWAQNEWERLGDQDSLHMALLYVISQQEDFTPDAPVNNYRLKGQGIIWEVYLNSN